MENKLKIKKLNDLNIYDIIFDRHRKISDSCYINVFACDDKKKQPKIYSYFFDLHKKDNKFIQNELETYNIGSYGVFMNFNLLTQPKRTDKNISKILYIFIDLDDAKEEHNLLIKENLNKKGITYCYNAKSGHGYHFLIPVLLEPNNKDKVKGFLTYLKHNVTDKVDIATYTNERLIRAPLSLHNKDDDSKQLKTLHTHNPTDEEIEQNNLLVLELQEEQKKGVKDIEYRNSIKKKDIFFNEILNNQIKWKSYYEILNNSIDRNPNFIKNLGLFLGQNQELKDYAYAFLNGWEPARIKAVEGWIKKYNNNSMIVNYYELLQWAKNNKIKEWVELLEIQVKSCFLDEFEFYYLEDEKPENNCIMYYVEKDYFIQKSITEIILNIYYTCKEKGMDLVEELNLKYIYDKWEEFPFKKRLNLILDQLRRKMEEENRIKMVFNIGYEPTDNKFIYFENKKLFNTYNKSLLWDYYKKQDIYHFPKIKELILNLCGKEEKNYIYFCKWLGWQVQNPEIKLPTAIIFQGKQGSGKGTFKDLILDNIFGNNCQEINQTDLECSFNDYLLGKQIIVANEVMHNENRQTLPNVLKNLVTDKKITIKRKFLKSIVGQNYTHWIFCTNSDNPIKIEEDDRRYSVFYSEKLRDNLSHEIRENLDFELKEFISYLKDLEISFNEVSEPIMTQAKEDIIDLNKNSVDKFLEYLKQFSNLVEAYVGIYGHLNDYKIKEDFGDNEKYILTENFYLLYYSWCEKYKEKGVFSKQNFSKKISLFKLKSTPKREKNKVFRMYNIREIENLINKK